MQLKILFMGTPDFAIPCLEALVENGYSVAGVFSQPDRKRGRGYTLTAPPVKIAAQKLGIPVYQPDTLRDGQALKIIESIAPDIIIVVAYGRILPPDILQYPKYGAINIHASLLPKLRGASPINHAIINGDTEGGVTSMRMDEGLDTGDMLIQKKTKIGEDMTAGELSGVLSNLGADALIETLAALKNKTLIAVPQDHSKATYAPLMGRDFGRIDFCSSAKDIHNLIRGTNPVPTAKCELLGKVLKIYKSRAVEYKGSAAPGEVINCDKAEGLKVACGEGAIEILELMLEGRKRVSAIDFINGGQINQGLILK